MLIQLSILILLVVLVLIIFFKKPSKDTSSEVLTNWLKTMQSSIDATNKTLNDTLNNSSNNMVKTLQENTKQLNERLDKAAEVIRGVGKEVGQMSEIGRSLKDFQEFLKNPKIRGNIGEQILKDLISQMLPKNSFNIQYQFKSGEKVDAAIKTDAGILPIDAKFPMENFLKITKAENEKDREEYKKMFTRDVKKHIDDISKKYILPEEGTMDFALMYVPSETVYYEIVNMSDIVDYARKARIYIVSPNTLYIHLQTILLSFEGRKIESKSKEVFRMLRALKTDYGKVSENMTVLGKHINNASSQFSNVSAGFFEFGTKLDSTKLLEQPKEEIN